jgi:pilus assembly protein Flp/PilA
MNVMVKGRLAKRIWSSAPLRLLRDRRAVTALEYGLLTGLIAVAIASGVAFFSTTASSVFTTVANTL